MGTAEKASGLPAGSGREKELGRPFHFLSPTPFIVRPLFRWSPLTESMEQANNQRICILRNCLVKHFNISRSEVAASGKECTITNRVARGRRVSRATVGESSLSVHSIVWCVDIVLTKVFPERRSISVTAVHGFVKILVLCQFDRIVSIGVVERENESFACRGATART